MPGFKDVHSSHIPGRAICTKIGQCHVWSAGRGAGSARDPGNDGRHSPNDDPLPGADQPVRDCMRAQPWEQSGAGGLSRTPGGCSPACPSPVPPGPPPVPCPAPPIPPGGQGGHHTPALLPHASTILVGGNFPLGRWACLHPRVLGIHSLAPGAGESPVPPDPCCVCGAGTRQLKSAPSQTQGASNGWYRTLGSAGHH